jgi:hypothetical protein
MFGKMKWLMEGEGAGGAGGAGADWRATLPEEIRNDPSLASFKDLGALARSLIETKALVGRSIRPPGPDASSEVKKEFVQKLIAIDPALIYAPDGDDAATARMWKKLGRPDKADEYEIPAMAKEAGIPEADLRALAVTGNLTKSQFAGLAELMGKAKLEEKRVAALERIALDQEWGEAKEERTLASKAAALKMGLTEVEVASLSPRQMRAFAAVAKAIGVNTAEFRSQQGAGVTPLDREEAKRQMEEIRANPAYFDAHTNPGLHASLVAKMSKLGEAAYG